MRLRATFLLVLLLSGCQDVQQPTPNQKASNTPLRKPTDAQLVTDNAPSQPGPPDNPEQPTQPIELPTEPAANPAAVGDGITHLVIQDAIYFKSAPQQDGSPDGGFRAGTKVTLVEDAGSYALVRSADGIEAYVSVTALQEVGMEMTPDLQAIVHGNNQFALDLYGQLRGREGNLFFSPTSISTALAMTFAGAEGDTQQQMANVLHFELPESRLHPAFAVLIERLSGKQPGAEVKVANRLWGQAGMEFLRDYLQITREQYYAPLAQLDFAGQTEVARKTINTWVDEQTNSKIQDLLPAGMLTSSTRLVLTNAIYFKGDWLKQFDKQKTQDAPFHVSADEQVDGPLMFQTEEFKYRQVEDVQVLELPYLGNRLAMVLLLPDEVDGLASLEEQLTADNLAKWVGAARRREVHVYLPSFTLTSRFSLNGALEQLGMAAAFDAQQADFSGMTGNRGLYISAAIHKAFVKVNEEGTEAAAATGIVATSESVQITPTFRADHPFVFLIRDSHTGSILFLGRVTNP